MPRSRLIVWLVVAATIAACQGQLAATDLRGDAGQPAPKASVSAGPSPEASALPTANPATGSATPSATPAPAATTGVGVVSPGPAASPAPTSVPAPTPFPGRRIVRVEISTGSLTLNTPRDLEASASFQDAGYPTRHQLIGMVHYSDNTYSTDVNWHSSDPALVTVDAEGFVTSRAPRASGTATITATARASSSFSASIPVVMVDFGKVHLDVY